MSTELTISQALRKISDLKGRLKKSLANAASNVQWDVKNVPAYVFSDELENAETLSAELLNLQTAVAMANATHTFEFKGKKVVLAYAVRRLDEIKGRIKWYEELFVHAQEDKKTESFEYADVGGRMERVKCEMHQKCALPEAKRDARMRELQEEFNALNDEVEKNNHRIVLAPI